MSSAMSTIWSSEEGGNRRITGENRIRETNMSAVYVQKILTCSYHDLTCSEMHTACFDAAYFDHIFLTSKQSKLGGR